MSDVRGQVGAARSRFSAHRKMVDSVRASRSSAGRPRVKPDWIADALLPQVIEREIRRPRDFRQMFPR